MIAAGTTGVFGTLPGWLTVIGIVVAAWIFYRGGGGTALSTLQEANRVLEKRVGELGAEIRDLKVENAQLREQTNVAEALVPAIKKIIDELGGAERRGMEGLARHEERASQRHDGQLKILGLIAERLGPDGNGNSAA